LSTDRPDATESPYTVEAGRWQTEIEPLRWSRDDEGGVRVDALVGGAVNLKYGLSPTMDLQFLLEPYVRVRTRVGNGPTGTTDGFGDTVVRWKINLRGNDTAGAAWGVMPFVKLPTASDGLGNDHLEGGLIVPVAFPLAGGWGGGLMAEVDVIRNDADTGYRAAFVTTATIARDIASNVGLFLELANEAVGSDTSDWAATFNTGLTVALSPEVQFDTGMNVGLTDAAEDIAAFVGLSLRW
jgi:hypothetical protein